MDGSTTTKTHEQFNASDADVTIKSSDGVLFHLHRKNLEMATGAFPGAEFDTRGEEVVLTEPADVLEILFQFIYPRRHPTLQGMEFEGVFAVAEAVEKYEVFPGVNTCTWKLRDFLPDHAAEILGHAINYDYHALIDETALLLSRSPLVQTMEELPHHSILPWARYSAAWHAIFMDALHSIQGIPNDVNSSSDCQRGWICGSCRPSLISWVPELETNENISSLKAAIQNPQLRDDANGHRRCSFCVRENCVYLPQVAKVLGDGIEAVPAFTSFLNGTC